MTVKLASLALCLLALRQEIGTEATVLHNQHPFLQNSAWPVTHQNTDATQASPLNAINISQKLVTDVLFTDELAGPLTVLYTSDGKVVWGSSLTSIFKVDLSAQSLRLIDSIPKDVTLAANDVFRGIYCVLSSEDIFYVSISNTIAAYTNKEAGNHFSPIRGIGRFILDYDRKPRENIIALTMTYDGYLVFVTSQARVGILTRDINLLLDIIDVSASWEPLVVTNSIVVDKYGGIYMVSSRYMHRLFWDSGNQKLHGIKTHSTKTFEHASLNCERSQIWTTPYDVEDEPILGRPTKQGSGTTPTLLHDGENIYVTIADGSLRQNVSRQERWWREQYLQTYRIEQLKCLLLEMAKMLTA